MFIINDKDRISKKTGDYFVNNGLHIQSPANNPEKYIVRLSHLKDNVVMALYEKKRILVGEAISFDSKHRESLDVLVFWYDEDESLPPRYLDYVYGASMYSNERSAVLHNADRLYKALVKNKIIFEVDYDR